MIAVIFVDTGEVDIICKSWSLFRSRYGGAGGHTGNSPGGADNYLEFIIMTRPDRAAALLSAVRKWC